ncbi:MAG: hypothetical protein K2L45_10525 [Muribaculaceae bacterium]|nr:hypothetical protein [Muribaculaceae bacterium]
MNIRRLKRIMMMATMTACVVTLSFKASAAYKIYKVKGNVTVKDKTKKEVKAQRRADVSLSDILSIPKDGSVQILNSDSHRIYSSVSSGKMSVKKLIDKAEAHAADITKNINRKVVAAVAETGKSKRIGYDALGMAIHETDVVAGSPIPLPEGISYLSYLMTNENDPDSIHQKYLALKTILTEEGNSSDGDAFNFAVDNFINRPLYFNIISRQNDGDLSLMLPRNPVVGPKTGTVVTEYTYIPDNNASRYIVIASDGDFNIEDVKRLLNPNYCPDNNFYLSLLRNNTTPIN